MIELSKHIEYLLMDNDCVIVPEFGGFITHYQSAYYEDSEGLFLPPTRSVGFNPRLTMNDGLLVQSYMQAYHTDFSDALRRIQNSVNRLKENLYQGEIVELPGVGSLQYNIYNEYEFQPQESGVLSPTLYGLDAFSIKPLAEVQAVEEILVPNQQMVRPASTKKEFRLNPHWLSNAVAVAVAIILFFVMSVPVENTYIDKGSYASLGTDCLFDVIRSQSMVTTLTVMEDNSQPNIRKEPRPVVVKVEKVASVKKEEPVKVEKKTQEVHSIQLEKKIESGNLESGNELVKKDRPTVKKEVAKKKRYHIIVASLATFADGQRMLKEYKQQGYKDASLIEGSGRFRIALCSFSEKSEANNRLNSLKQQDAFKSAWLLSSK